MRLADESLCTPLPIAAIEILSIGIWPSRMLLYDLKETYKLQWQCLLGGVACVLAGLFCFDFEIFAAIIL